MKKITELGIGIIAIVSAIILEGCSKSVDNGVTPTNAQKSKPIHTEVTPPVGPSTVHTPTSTPTPTVTHTPPATLKPEASTSSISAISDAYMDAIKITESCPEAEYERKEDGTYGTVIHKTYDSKTTGLTRGVNIVLPPNYDESKKYSVLYLLHGIFGDEYSFINDNNNNKIVELSGNLITEGKAKEMIIVLPNMFAASNKDLQPGFTAESSAAYDNFINDLANDLMPFME